jgi:uncharacterized protein YcgI (DUF1989 family)
MAERLLVAAGGGAGLRLKRGEQLRIIDIEGGQTGDLAQSARRDGSPDRAFLVSRIHLQCRRANQAPGI